MPSTDMIGSRENCMEQKKRSGNNMPHLQAMLPLIQ